MNAADNKQRDPTMDKLEINVNAEANKISVKNNGKGIPVVHHKEHNCYVPTLIFGLQNAFRSSWQSTPYSSATFFGKVKSPGSA